MTKSTKPLIMGPLGSQSVPSSKSAVSRLQHAVVMIIRLDLRWGFPVQPEKKAQRPRMLKRRSFVLAMIGNDGELRWEGDIVKK